MPHNIIIDTALVSELIATQFPEYAHLTIKPVEFGGWDNRTFHLGTNMTVRLPSSEEYVPAVEKEQRWLPKLAPLLPLPIPTPLALGKPSEKYPYPWSVYTWIDGETAAKGHIENLTTFATDLADFLATLQKLDASGGPLNPWRGSAPLAQYDAQARESLTILKNKIDVKAATEIWETALASTWQHKPVWFHGDVSVGNVLVHNGRLSAVIDFGSVGVGDPACDLVMTWTLFKDESRKAFRNALPLDKATWNRARGWALWKALIVCAELPGMNLLEIEKSWLVLNEIITDYKDEITHQSH